MTLTTIGDRFRRLALDTLECYQRGSCISGWMTCQAAAPAIAAFFALAVATTLPAAAYEAAVTSAPRAQARGNPTQQGRLFDAVVKTTLQHFAATGRLKATEFEKLAAAQRSSVVGAANLASAVERINRLLGALKTSHTALYTPDQVEYFILLDVFGQQHSLKEFVASRFGDGPVTYDGIGVFATDVAGRTFVDGILEGSPAARSGLQYGDEIVSVDGAPFAPIDSFRGKAGHQARVALRRTPDGPVETVLVTVERISPLQSFRQGMADSFKVHKVDGKRIGYVHVWASRGGDFQKTLSETLEKAANPPLDGLIVDMRGKVGGDIGTARAYLQAIAPRGPMIAMRGRHGASPAPQSYRGRSAVLIDHHTRSAAEIFSQGYKAEQLGPLIGTRTARAISASQLFLMPGGMLLHMAVAELEINGANLEGIGVEPDIEIERPLPYAQGADPVLARAIAELSGRDREVEQRAP